MYGSVRVFAKTITDKRFVKITSSLFCIGYTFAAWKSLQKVPTLKYLTWLDTLKSPHEVRCQGTDKTSPAAVEKPKKEQDEESRIIHPPENERRIVLIGATDYAKDTVAHLLLQDQKSCCLPKKTELQTRKITVQSTAFKVDIINATPVVDYSRIPDDKKIFEIYKAVALSSPGPHALLLCIPASKIEEKYCNAIKQYEDLFGDAIYDFVFVVFTHYDEYHRFNEDEPSINRGAKKRLLEKELNKAIRKFKVLRKIKNVTEDYIVLDSDLTATVKEEKIKQVFDVIRQRERKRKSEKGKFATCVLSEYAEKEIQERVRNTTKGNDGEFLRDEVKKSNEFIDMFSYRT